MHGWRTRVGLIVPSSNTTNEPEFQVALPEGVSLHTSRMRLVEPTPETLERMAEDADRCADLLSTADIDIVAYGCTTGSLIKGAGYDERLESKLEAQAGVPAVVTAAAIRRAFDALGLESLAIATPYVEELNDREREFLEAAGHSIVDMEGLGIDLNRDIGALRPERMYRLGRSLDHAEADGVFLSCTNARTFEIIPTLEADLGKPVVTSNQATLWDTLRRVGVSEVGRDLGRLFDQ